VSADFASSGWTQTRALGVAAEGGPSGHLRPAGTILGARMVRACGCRGLFWRTFCRRLGPVALAVERRIVAIDFMP